MPQKNKLLRRIVELQKEIRSSRYDNLAKQINTLLLRFVTKAKMRISSPCVSPLDREELSALNKLLRNSLPTDVYEELFRLPIEVKNRPEHIYNQPVMRVFVTLLTFAALRRDEALLKRVFLAYMYRTFFLIFAKRFKVCDPELMMIAFGKLVKKTEVARANNDYDLLVTMKTNSYFMYIQKAYKSGSLIELLASLTVAMDYAKNSLNNALKVLARAYYEAHKERQQAGRKQYKEKRTLQMYKRVIRLNFHKYFNDKEYVKQFVQRPIKHEVMYCLTKALVSEKYEPFFDTLLSLIEKLSDVSNTDLCAPDWFKLMDLLPGRRDQWGRKLKETLQKFYDAVQEECPLLKYYVNNYTYEYKMRKILVRMFVDVLTMSVCKEVTT